MAVDSVGDVLVTGWATSPSLNLGGTPLTGAGSFDAFAAKYSGANGAHVWSKAFGSTGVEGLLSVAADANDDVLVSGRYQGTVSFGGAPLVSNGATDIVVAKLAKANGAEVWSHGHGGTFDDYGRAVISDGSGNAVMAGYKTGAVDLGGGSLAAYGQTDLAVAKYAAANGSHQWSIGPGGSLLDSCTDIDRDGSDFVVVGGYRSSNLDFGFGALPATAVTSLYSLRLSGTTGAPVSSRAYAASGADAAVYRAKVNPKTRALIMVGYFGGTLTIDGAQLATAGKDDIFVASVAPMP